MSVRKSIDPPSPIIWMWAVGVPLMAFSPAPTLWPYWLLVAACWYVICDWALKSWIRRRSPVDPDADLGDD